MNLFMIGKINFFIFYKSKTNTKNKKKNENIFGEIEIIKKFYQIIYLFHIYIF